MSMNLRVRALSPTNAGRERVAFAGLLAACACDPGPAASAPVALPDVAAVTTSAESQACLPKATRYGGLVRVAVTGAKATLCFGQGKSSDAVCIDVDLASGAQSNARHFTPDAPLPEPTRAVTLTTTKDTVTVCKPECVAIKIEVKSSGANSALVAAANADATRIFVFVTELASGKDPELATSWTMWGDTYDTTTKRRVTHAKMTRDNGDGTNFSGLTTGLGATYVGKNLIVEERICCGHGGHALLFDPVSARMIDLHESSGEHARVSGSVFAIIEAKGVGFVDVDAMQAVGPIVRAPGRPVASEKATSALVAAAGWNHVVFVGANPPTYAVIDITSSTAPQMKSLTLCP